MPEIKLKPCPFCGGEAELITLSISGGAWARCKKCGANSQFFLCAEQAVDAWNCRADMRNEAQPVLYDGAFGACPNCEYEFNSELRNEYEIRYCPICGAEIGLE